MTEHPPMHKARAFDCPHCGAHSQQMWGTCMAKAGAGGEFNPFIDVSTCFACGKRTIWHNYVQGPPNTISGSLPRYRIVYPTAKKVGPPRSADMPADVAELYDEASEVAGLSPRSASVLLRLALEALLEHLYPDSKGNLNAMIGAAVKAGLPEGVQKAMDFVRFGGNTSAHEIRYDDDAETALTMFRLLNIVVERLITEPKEIDELFAGLPEDKRAQVERRDGNRAAPAQ